MSEVEKAERQFSVLNRVPVGVLVLQQDLTLLFWNNMLEDWTGISRDKIVGTYIGDHFPHLNEPKYTRRIQNIFTGGPPIVFSAQLHKHIIPASLPNGQLRIQHTIITAVRTLDGTNVYALFSIQDVTDVTQRIYDYRLMRDRALTEVEERKRAEKALQKSEQRFRAIFETSGVGVVLSTLAGEIIQTNPAFQAMLGYTEEEFHNKSILHLTHPDDVNQEATIIRQPLLDEGPTYHQFEKRFIRKNGQIIWTRLTGSFITDNHSKPSYGLSVIEDITERKQAEESLRKAHNELEQRVEERTRELQEAQEQLVRQENLAALGQLAGGVGHELRNPLGVISNAVYFLKMVLSDADDTVKEYLDLISARVWESEKIISDLLNLSRTRAIEKQKAVLSTLVAEVLQRHPAPTLITVTTNIPADLPDVFVDSQQISQVLANLVTNAYQAMVDGGELIIKAQTELDGVHLSITDTGLGMSSEIMEKIFEPLFTTKTKGIGLGLVICKNLVEINGGHIEVDSAEGQGSMFTTILPIYQQEKIKNS